MKTLYHGSPIELKTIKPNQSNGIFEFENKQAVYLTDDFLLASLYACSKHLKGKTKFAVFPYQIVILGDFDIDDGFVYKVDLGIATEQENRQWTCDYEISDIKNTYKINKNDMEKYIVRVSSLDEIKKIIDNN